MKYGIRVTYDDGRVTYVSSTRFKAVENDSITEMALFVQKDSAVKAVKTIRKDGGEPENATLDVIGITFSVCDVIEVERPPTVSGFIIVVEKPEHFVKRQYFNGTKKTGVYPQYNSFGTAITRATVFANEKTAKLRLESLVQEAKANLESTKQKKLYDYLIPFAEQTLKDLEKAIIISHEG